MLRFSLRHPRLVRHLATWQLKATMGRASIEMSRILEKQEPTNFAGIITGDESCFCELFEKS
jgi:hypothetical protein